MRKNISRQTCLHNLRSLQLSLEMLKKRRGKDFNVNLLEPLEAPLIRLR